MPRPNRTQFLAASAIIHSGFGFVSPECDDDPNTQIVQQFLDHTPSTFSSQVA
jgi:hypothetical protein